MPTIRFAVLGTGMVARVHADAIRSLPEAELTYVYSRTEEAGQRFAEAYGCRRSTDLEAVLGSAEVDAVAICTPSGTHADYAIQAARRRKHVLVEKPLDITLENADAAIQACAGNGVKLGVIFQLRFMSEALRAKKLLDDGMIGKLIEADAYMKFYRPEAYYRNSTWKGTHRLDGGGSLMNQGIHGIDLLLWLAGPVQSVSARVRTLKHEIEAEDTAAAVVQFRNGAIGVIQGTTSVYPDHPQLLAFHGTNGTLELAGTEVPYIRNLNVQDRPELNILSSQPPDDHLGEAHRLQFRDFIQAIRENRSPLIDGKEGRRALELVTAIYESSKYNRTVRLDEP
ncbi:Gfo/Idh/MocA family oxidoreductase [Paenibacillus filicis]|uniref:Gfo/Idh/MocA family oxidoreductase n=1 Tax=Paenibacillus gyeongsangnamensis TaxID=3388067 RepID=A0ABT4QGR8_9BACL|nr:Gfo/Idh/MocA family oxidoreductase [Paenibacillus filicis]MCZ8516079.1 Gfo/Idh/MocA family oxidoreductase [Paenibacillus filicis]